VQERYAREALMHGFRILGEGQLALTKFLLLTDASINLHDFPRVLEHVLARVKWESDFFIFGNTSMDTLDYTSGTVNRGSKAILMGLGDAVRDLPHEFRGELPNGISHAEVFCGGCLVVQGEPYFKDQEQAARLASDSVFADWPLIVLHDDAGVAKSVSDFLWSTWTRFEPAGDIYARETKVVRHHLSYRAPIVIDARKKPSLPDELEVREDIGTLVDVRWDEYFPNGAL
jgi:3-polyprenyl-4-hydroxybenzoate decarboxylase